MSITDMDVFYQDTHSNFSYFTTLYGYGKKRSMNG